MFRISWVRKSDKFHKTFVIVPDVYSLFEAYFVITRYGGDDGCSPTEVIVTNLDGVVVDMSLGMAAVASMGTLGGR
jgi:hypothetical protein